jgi:hypothetical protein
LRPNRMRVNSDVHDVRTAGGSGRLIFGTRD